VAGVVGAALLAPGAAQAHDFVVTQSTDPAPYDVCDTNCTLRDAIDLSNTNGEDDTIDILIGTSLDLNGDGIPDDVGCPCDWDHSGAINSQDYFDFLTGVDRTPAGGPIEVVVHLYSTRHNHHVRVKVPCDAAESIAPPTSPPSNVYVVVKLMVGLKTRSLPAASAAERAASMPPAKDQAMERAATPPAT